MPAIVTSVPFSRYHQRILAMALHKTKPQNGDYIRERTDNWVKMCAEIGAAIREQGGQFDMDKWTQLCYYGPE